MDKLNGFENLLIEGEEIRKEARRQYLREWRANIPEEQKEVKRKYAREYIANMTEEQRSS